MNRHSLLFRTTSALAALALALSVLSVALVASVQQARAATLAEQILCYVDQQLGPNIPFSPDTDYCDSGGPGEPGPMPQCFDGDDNDNDGLVDMADPGCSGPTDNSEDSDDNGNGTTTPMACEDTVDNDGDTLIDLNDPGCTDANDNDETNSTSTPATSTVTVTVHKYVEDSHATTGNAGGASFGFASSWNNEGGSGEGSGTFDLGSGNSYMTTTSALNEGSSYAVHEVTTAQASSSSVLPAGADCEEGMWRLMGYRTGSSLSGAESATLTTTSPDISNLASDQHIIVVNEECEDNGNGTTTDAALHVDSIEAVKTSAVANDTYADGWRYIFHITAPSDEENLAMRFSDWVSGSSSSTIPVGSNMRISSAQASSTDTITLTGSNMYSSPALVMTTDLNPSMPGRQVDVVVEVKIPTSTPNETFTTSYGVQTLP